MQFSWQVLFFASFLLSSVSIMPFAFAQSITSITSPPPLKQLTFGILAKDVHCNQGLFLLIKTKNGNPACVKPQTAEKLVKHGWSSLTTPIPRPPQGPNVIWGNSTISFISINPTSGNSPLNVTFQIFLKSPVPLMGIEWLYGDTFGTGWNRSDPATHIFTTPGIYHGSVKVLSGGEPNTPAPILLEKINFTVVVNR